MFSFATTELHASALLKVRAHQGLEQMLNARLQMQSKVKVKAHNLQPKGGLLEFLLRILLHLFEIYE